MEPTDDSALLRQYAESNSDEAFTALVQRHVSLVYSVGLRQTGKPHAAEEITQAVFIILAKKAAQLRHDKALSSWLFHATRLTANNFIRSESRRRHREEEAYMQSVLDETGTELWIKISPLLDSAVAGLREKDRQAILLRFYEGRNLREVGVALGASEAAAEKRVNRALEKLRKFFTRRGVSSTTAIIAGTISANSVQAAPVALAKTVTTVAIAKGAAASGSTLTLIKGALKIMAWTKMKMAVVVGVGVLLAVGTATVTVKEIQNHNDDKWDTEIADTQNLNKAPHIVKIIPTKFPDRGGAWARGGNRIIGVGADPKQIILAVYGVRETRAIFSTALPQKKYDFMGNLPSGTLDALKELIKKQFNAVGKTEVIETNVLFLRVKQPDAPGLKKPTNQNGTSSSQNIGERGEIDLKNGTMSDITSFVEGQLGEIPVIDQTSRRRNFDADLVWDRKTNSNENLKQALIDQLGLELVPGVAPIEFLIVEKVQ
ncbi:MAG TPA: TIGR03435 family protein [Verrucomicrobiae bacterium]